MDVVKITKNQLAVECHGQGQPVVMLHGWGMNSAVFRHLPAKLARGYQYQLLDLPGFGDSGGVLAAEPDAAVEQLRAAIPAGAHLVGWSLGGLLAMALARRYPAHLASLVLVATTPRFVAAPDWPGIKAQVLANFARQLAGDTTAVIQRFLAIQAMGSEGARQHVQQIRQQLATKPAPKAASLKNGLRLLEHVDLRAELGAIRLPALRLYGRLDSLVPVAGMEAVRRLWPGSAQHLFEHASHAPFISHPDRFVATLNGWLEALGQ